MYYSKKRIIQSGANKARRNRRLGLGLGLCVETRHDELMKPHKNPKISKTTTTRGAAEIVGSIEDLLKQILLHLPLKPLFRFKSVSKQWNSIISDPRFQFLLVKQHSSNRAVVGLVFEYHCREKQKTQQRVVFFEHRSSNPPQILQIPDTLSICHSCNGLLLLWKNNYDYYVYNPTTNQISPPLRDEKAAEAARESDCFAGMNLAFDPSKSPHYKVVCVWDTDKRLADEASDTFEVEFEVYSSQTGSWESRGRHIVSSYIDFEEGVYWNKAVHWVSCYDRECLYFNPDDDHGMPRVMPNVPIHHSDRLGGRFYFGESCGHLHCAGLVGGGDDLARRGIYVYEMRSDYSEWFLKYRVVHDDYSHYKVQHLFSVVRGGKEDEDEDSNFLVLETGEGDVICYNPVHNTCQSIQVKSFDIDIRISTPFHYIESPCSV